MYLVCLLSELKNDNIYTLLPPLWVDPKDRPKRCRFAQLTRGTEGSITRISTVGLETEIRHHPDIATSFSAAVPQSV